LLSRKDKRRKVAREIERLSFDFDTTTPPCAVENHCDGKFNLIYVINTNNFIHNIK